MKNLLTRFTGKAAAMLWTRAFDAVKRTGDDEVETHSSEIDPRVATDIASYLLTRFPEGYDLPPLEERVRGALAIPARRPLVPFLAAFSEITHAYAKAVPGAQPEKLRDDAEKAFVEYEGAERLVLLLRDEKFQLVALQEFFAETIGKELLGHISVRGVQGVVQQATADTIVRGILADSEGLDFRAAESLFLGLPPEWLRLVSDTMTALISALHKKLAEKAGDMTAAHVLEKNVVGMGEGLKSLPAFHNLLRTLPVGAIGTAYLESMSRAELEHEVERRTEDLMKKTREQDALLSENELLAAFPENNPNPILGVAPDGTILYENPASALLRKELSLASAEMLLPAEHMTTLSDSYESGKLLRLESKAGERYFEWLYAPFRGYGQVHVYANDVTSRKQIQTLLDETDRAGKMLVRKDRELSSQNTELQSLNQDLSTMAKELVRRDLDLTEANNRLRDLDKMKSEFVSVAAHQLRTPLTGIRWTLQALVDRELGELTAKQEMFAKTALKTVVGAVSLINDLLSVARMEEGRFSYALKPADIVAVTRRSVLRFMPIAGDKGVTLTAEIEAAPPELKLDEEKIEMCIDNLIDNAIKYTESGGKVVVGMTMDAESVHIRISDTGVGIPESERYKIFSKFFRAHNAQLLHTAGSGLGLYIVRNIVERHLGLVSFTSAEGKGTTFTISLPVPKT